MKKIICLVTIFGAVGCSQLSQYEGTQKQIKEFAVNGLQLYFITNRAQFPVPPRSPQTVGMWIMRYGMSEEIWVCATVSGEMWTPEPGVLEHELLHALHNRDKVAIQNPDKPRKLGEIAVLHEVTRN